MASSFRGKDGRDARSVVPGEGRPYPTSLFESGEECGRSLAPGGGDGQWSERPLSRVSGVRARRIARWPQRRVGMERLRPSGRLERSLPGGLAREDCVAPGPTLSLPLAVPAALREG